LEDLLRGRADVSAAEPEGSPFAGSTALHVAARQGHVATAVLLARSPGAQPRALDQLGDAPLDIAARLGLHHVCAAIAKAARLNLAECGGRAAWIAADAGHLQVMECFLREQVRLDSYADTSANTALHACCRRGDATMVQLLLERGRRLDVGARNREGLRPEDVAELSGHSDVARIIRMAAPAEGSGRSGGGTGGPVGRWLARICRCYQATAGSKVEPYDAVLPRPAAAGAAPLSDEEHLSVGDPVRIEGTATGGSPAEFSRGKVVAFNPMTCRYLVQVEGESTTRDFHGASLRPLPGAAPFTPLG